MVGLVVMTHGNFGAELLKTAEMILGPQQAAVAVPLYADSSPEQYEQDVKQAISSLSACKSIIVITDLVGGTPMNVAVALSRAENIAAVLTGANLPMMLEICSCRSQTNIEQIVDAAQAGAKAGIRMIQCNLQSMS